MKRSSTAKWNGSGKEGSGTISSESKVLNNATFSTRTRFQDAEGTSPEELIAAAHAACFSMKLSFVLGEAGFTPDSIETTSTVEIGTDTITNSHLVVKAKVPGITAEKFQECAADAKENCPVSKLLNAKITMEATLL
ncbi:MAG: OsmC family protein [Chitinophagales bacterium]|nr:OsmC family protein [Chitinophagales bacterium]